MYVLNLNYINNKESYYMLCVLCQRRLVSKNTCLGYRKYVYNKSTYASHR